MSDIKVRVGQQNAIKVVSSISGASGGRAVTAENVIGGIGSIRELHVSGISTFVGISTFKSDVYIDGDLVVGDDLKFDEFTARNGNITGIASVYNLNVTGVSSFVGISTFNNNVYISGDLTVSDDIFADEISARSSAVSISTVVTRFYYGAGIFYPNNAILYFGPQGLVSATNAPGIGNTDTSNYVLTTNNSNIPTWSNVIDGGDY